MNNIIGIIEDGSMEVIVEINGSGPQGEQGPPGPPGTTNYNDLTNKPSLESVELIGDKTFEDLGVSNINKVEISNIF